jgi:hypothetical protein
MPYHRRMKKWAPMRQFAVLIVVATASMMPALALTPLAKPGPFTDVDPTDASAYQGSWSITVPTMDVGEPDTVYAQCKLPVRIAPADETHLFYLGPRETEADAALELLPVNNGARWEPIAGGPSFFAFWVSADVFYLYDMVPETDADWGMPFVYRRCP